MVTITNNQNFGDIDRQSNTNYQNLTTDENHSDTKLKVKADFNYLNKVRPLKVYAEEKRATSDMKYLMRAVMVLEEA